MFDILKIYSIYIENELKKLNFCLNSESSFSIIINNIKYSNTFFLNQNNINSNVNNNIEEFRKNVDNFICLIKNEISFIIRCYDLNNLYSNVCNYESDDNIMKVLKINFDLLNDYIKHCKSRIINIHVLINMGDILIIIKKVFINTFQKIFGLFFIIFQSILSKSLKVP